MGGLLLSTLLLSGLLLTTANKCPEPGDMEPYCSCWPDKGPTGGPPSTICENIENVAALKEVFSATGDHPFVDLEVARTVMSYFPAHALKEKNVRELALSEVNLVGLFDRVPEPNNKLRSLKMRMSKIFRGMEWPLLKNLNNLTYLFIDGVTIRSLGKEFMDNVPRSLNQLLLSSNKMSRLKNRVFSRLTELTLLSVVQGRITTLKRTMFPAAGNVIERLNFQFNKISELPDNIFSDMPKLQYVSLENNLLKTISETIFKEIGGRNLETVLLDNNIKCDCKIRWTMKTEWKKLEAKCHSPKQFKDKTLVGGLSDDDLNYCDDVRR